MRHRAYAIAYRYYSIAYISAEESAKANRRGLWAGTFEMPSQYRHEEKVVSRSKSQPSGNCRIKANRGKHGWIYHVPGQRYYNQTFAEQMFCTEREARAAGYRRSKV